MSGALCVHPTSSVWLRTYIKFLVHTQPVAPRPSPRVLVNARGFEHQVTVVQLPQQSTTGIPEG